VLENEPDRRRRLKPTDFPPPEAVSAETLKDIFFEFEIEDEQQQTSVTSLLNRLVQEVAEWIKTPKKRRAGDHKLMQEMQRTIAHLLEDINQLGLFGTRALKSIDERIGPMLAAEWINCRFPDDDWAPRKAWVASSNVGRPPAREPQRAERYYVEELSRHARVLFVQNRARETIREILLELDRGITSAVALSKNLGGPPTLAARHLFLFNLVVLWSSLNRDVSAGPKSEFVTFCERILEAVGWPVGGLDDAIRDAIKDWRQGLGLTPPKKSAR
jgi:hypothetical protein